MRMIAALLMLVQEGESLARWREIGKGGIRDEHFESMLKLIRPKPWGFEEIPWMTSLWEARRKAAAEGKPLFLWTGEGHPLGFP